MARDAVGGVAGATRGQPRWLGGAPFVIPHLETSDVQLKGPPAKVQRHPLHQQLVLREDRVAGVARFAVAWTTPHPFEAVMRQAPVLQLRRIRRRRASWSIVASCVAAAVCYFGASRLSASQIWKHTTWN